MEIVQGKSTDKKIIIAQEIAFAKVLAGNDKTLRDRGVKKLKKWLTLRGNGKWMFTEDEFLRIWTGLFYCMWMSDKFIVQEELAESISQLIHCFKKNSESALLFIKCFNKRILMEWDGLDQYRIDKFNMLTRRFLRQTFVYCRRQNWDESILKKLMDIFSDVVLQNDNSLGFVLHFINIYAEELAKVGKGKLQSKTVLTAIEPFVKFLSTTTDSRMRDEIEEFFQYLMRQSDVGVEFEEQLKAWKKQGFPGTGPECMKREEVNGDDFSLENGQDSLSEDDENEDMLENDVLDPRAGSVHVVLPQIPLDIDAIINLFNKYKKSSQTTVRGRKLLKSLIQKFSVVKKGRFPMKIRKDPMLVERINKKGQSKKNAKELLEFTEKLDEGPIKTKEFKKIMRELDLDEDSNAEEEEKEESCENEEENNIADEDEENISDGELEEELIEHKKSVKMKTKKKELKKNNFSSKINTKNDNKTVVPPIGSKKINGVKEVKDKNDKKISVEGEKSEKKSSKKKKSKKKAKSNEISVKGILKSEEKTGKTTEKPKTPNSFSKEENQATEVISEGSKVDEDSIKVTPLKRAGIKRKILSSWQVQDLDTSSPEYFKIETPKIIRLEKKVVKTPDSEENQESKEEENGIENVEQGNEKKEDVFLPVFWEKARAKAFKKRNSKGNSTFLNPYAEVNGESKSPRGDLRRISFALEKNMAQENDEYLEEVRNSPKIPFDGSKKPVQSALKSGLSPSPVNPFYRFKKIKF